MIPQQQSDILNRTCTKTKGNISTTQLHRCGSEYPNDGEEELMEANGKKNQCFLSL